MEKGHNKVNTLRILTVSNAITVDFWDGDRKKKKGEEDEPGRCAK